MVNPDSLNFQKKQTKSLILAALFVFLLTNCGNLIKTDNVSNTNLRSNSETNKTMEVSNDIEKLGNVINFPVKPEKVVWQAVVRGGESTIPGPSDYELRAILTFSKADADKITKKASEKETPRDIPTIPMYKFIPAELKDKLKKDGDNYKFEGDLLDASEFYKSSFRDGYLVRIKDTNQFFLHLFTM